MSQPALDIQLIHRLRHVIILAIAFLIPIFPKLLPPAIGLLTLLWLIIIIRDRKISMGSWHRSVLWVPVCFYLLHLAGLIWSENLKFGIRDIEIKFSMLLLPLLLLSGAVIRKSLVKQVMNIFTLGCIVNMIVILIRAFIRYPVTGSNAYFYNELSFLFHPGYLSMYYTLALVWVLYKSFYVLSTFDHIMHVSVIVLFTIIIALLASKVAMLVLLMIVIFFITKALSQRESRGQRLLVVASIPVVLISTFLLALPYKNRFVEFTDRNDSSMVHSEANSVNKTVNEKVEPGSSEVRMMAWKIALEAIGENLPIGTGTGDIKDVLISKYRMRNADVLLRVEVNPHNQYLQTSLALGLPGLLLLCLILWNILRSYIKSGNLLIGCFGLIIGVNAMVESILEVQAGVIFFSFMYSVLIGSVPEESPLP